MKKLAFALLIGTACAFCWAQEPPTKKDESKPTFTFYFTTGAFDCPTYHVNIRNDRLLIRKCKKLHDEANLRWTERQFKDNEKADLIALLKKLAANNWKPDCGQGLGDPTTWSVVLDCPDLRVSSKGVGAYPQLQNYNEMKKYISDKLIGEPIAE